MSYSGTTINPDESLVCEEKQDREEREGRLPLRQTSNPEGLDEWYQATWWWQRPSPLDFSLNTGAMERLVGVLEAEGGGTLEVDTELTGDPELGMGEIQVVSAQEALRVATVLWKLIASDRLDDGWGEFAAFCEQAGMCGDGFSFA